MTELLAPRGVAHVHLLGSVFSGRRRTHEVAAGASVLDAISAHWPDEWRSEPPLPRLVIVHNGRSLTEPQDLRATIAAGDHVAVYPRVAGGLEIAAAQLLGEAISSAIQYAGQAVGSLVGFNASVQYGINALLGVSRPSVGHDNRTPQYSWDGVNTEYAAYGSVIPASFGEQILAGAVISYSVVVRKNKSILKLLLNLGHGPFESIAGSTTELEGVSGDQFTDTRFRLDGTPVQEWGGIVRVWTRLGKVDQSPIPRMNDEERSYPVGLRLKKGEAKSALTRTPVNSVRLVFSFPDGIYWLNEDGEFVSQTVKFRVRFRRQDLTDSPINYSAWDYFSFHGDKPSPLPRGYTVEFPELRMYAVYVERLSDEPLRTDGVSSKSRSEWAAIVDIVERDLEYPGQALIALEVAAVDGLSGGRPNVEVPAKCIRVMIPDTDDQDGAHTRAWSRCPFWISYNYLRDTNYGLGDAMRNVLFDVADWRAGSEHAAELVSTGVSSQILLPLGVGFSTIRVAKAREFKAGDLAKINLGLVDEELVEIDSVVDDYQLALVSRLTAAHGFQSTLTRVHARYEWDGTLDGSGSPWETVQEILATARARIVLIGDRMILVRAVPREPVMLICEGNGADDFVEVRENERFQPNALDLQFWNRDNRYQRDNRLVIAEDAVVDSVSDATFFDREELNPKQEMAFGVSRPEQVERHGRYRLRQLRRSVRGWGCTLPLEACVAPVGSVVEVAHRVVIAVTWSGRTTAAAASASSTIRLDQPVELEAATTYVVRVRVGKTALATRTITSAAGSYARDAALSISGTWPDDVDAGAPYALGLQGQETALAEVVSYARLDDNRVVIATKEYVEDALADL